MIIFQDDDEAILDPPALSSFSKFHLSSTSFVNDPLLTSSDQLDLSSILSSNTNGNGGHCSSNGNVNSSVDIAASSSSSHFIADGFKQSSSGLKPSLSNTSLSSMGSSSGGASIVKHHRRRSSGSSGASSIVKKPTWFQDDGSDSHHFDINILASTSQGEFKSVPSHKIFHAGDHIEVHLKVNVKRLQFLKCTFEGVSTSHNNKTHILSKETIVAHDFHLYPTAVDQELIKNRSKSLNLSSPPSLSNILPSTNTSTTNLFNKLSLTTPSNNISNNTTTATTNTDSSSSTPSPPLPNKPLSPTVQSSLQESQQQQKNNDTGNVLKQTIDIKKSVSNDLLLLYNHSLDQDDQCPFLEPLPEIQESSFNPPIIHSCSEHQVLTERTHKFIFRYTIPSYLPTSFSINKDTKNGVFYRLAFSGLGELHNKFKSDGPLIKGINTTVPIGIINSLTTYSNIRNDLMVVDKIKSFSNTLNNITLKSRLLYNNFGIIGSNVSLYLTIDNQSDGIIKGFRLRLVNKQQSWKGSSVNNENISTSGGNSNSNMSEIVNNENSSSNNSNSNGGKGNSNSVTTTTATNIDKNKKSKNRNSKDNSNSKSTTTTTNIDKTKKLNNINDNNVIENVNNNSNSNIDLDEQEEDEDLYCTSNNTVASIKFKSNDYFIQAKTKYNTTICFSIPINILSTIHLSNISNSYTFRISLRKTKHHHLEFPITILPTSFTPQ
ncbi:hypothetical protein CYY_005149 [Polysphondylium violaceum]|uniref:Uncharacterized protein n=1 Tax=Polysphondylium violaceum TaxID=133409 RepID=A0A8J4UYS6_9MYCE|nr:hypothetical protein CYY_005149 [Polysphondylium violaceum]